MKQQDFKQYNLIYITWEAPGTTQNNKHKTNNQKKRFTMIYKSFDRETCEILLAFAKAMQSVVYDCKYSLKITPIFNGEEYDLHFISDSSYYFTNSEGKTLRISDHWTASNVLELNINDVIGQTFMFLNKAWEHAFKADNDVVYCGGFIDESADHYEAPEYVNIINYYGLECVRTLKKQEEKHREEIADLKRELAPKRVVAKVLKPVRRRGV